MTAAGSRTRSCAGTQGGTWEQGEGGCSVANEGGSRRPIEACGQGDGGASGMACRRGRGGWGSGRALLYLLGAAVLLAEAPGGRVGGQYFLYGSLDYKQTGITETGVTVLFTLKTAWRRSFFDKSAVQNPYGPCNPCRGDGVSTSNQKECSDICRQPLCSCLLTLPGDSVYIFDPRDEDPATGLRPRVPVSTTFSFGENPDDSLTGRRSDQGPSFRPTCLVVNSNGQVTDPVPPPPPPSY